MRNDSGYGSDMVCFEDDFESETDKLKAFTRVSVL